MHFDDAVYNVRPVHREMSDGHGEQNSEHDEDSRFH